MTTDCNHDNPIRVLVFPCGTEIGLEIHRALCASRHVALRGASSVPSNHGPFVFKQYLEQLPFVNDPAFLGCLNALIARHDVDLIYPAHDDAVLALSRRESEIGCEIVGSPAQTCALCRSKTAVYAKFHRRIATPRLYARDHRNPPFPLFLKPDAGQGSQGVMVAHSKNDWDTALEKDPSVIALEYLPGKEYTVDCFTDRHGALRFVGPRERLRTMNGISVHARPVDDEAFSTYANIINEATVFRGAWFFQMKRDVEERLALLEVAPRVSGGMGLYRNLDVNLPLLSVYDRLGRDLNLCPMEHGIEMDRALIARFRLDIVYKHVYLDLDDTLLCGDQLNPLLVAFVCQCRNMGKQVHVLTRHAGNPEETLARYGIIALFDSIIHVGTAENKADYIAQKDAIFIDDSHAERKRVREALRIPVFAPDAVESLLDWRR